VRRSIAPELPQGSRWNKQFVARIQSVMKAIAVCSKTFSPGRAEMLTRLDVSAPIDSAHSR
jgi:hypothetical protein